MRISSSETLGWCLNYLDGSFSRLLACWARKACDLAYEEPPNLFIWLGSLSIEGRFLLCWISLRVRLALKPAACSSNAPSLLAHLFSGPFLLLVRFCFEIATMRQRMGAQAVFSGF